MQGRPADGDGQGVLRPPGPDGQASTPGRKAPRPPSIGRSTSTTSRRASRTTRRPRLAGRVLSASRQDGLHRRRRSASASRSAARATPSACAATPTASARSSWTGSSLSRSRSSSTSVLAVYGDRLTLERPAVKAACLDFFAGRLRFILEKQGFRYDLVTAALGPGIGPDH
ncbi:MAG: hypothetical protein M0C28_38505 [Candidatus Moduliflexus flocculans]|nr:hypothetical protein [Candidatus Moduliflexus flocculans]